MHGAGCLTASTGPAASTADADPPKMKVKMFCEEREREKKNSSSNAQRFLKRKKIFLLPNGCFLKMRLGSGSSVLLLQEPAGTV